MFQEVVPDGDINWKVNEMGTFQVTRFIKSEGSRVILLDGFIKCI